MWRKVVTYSLNREPARKLDVVLSNLVVEVQVLLGLHRSHRGCIKDVDTGQPLARPGTDISTNNGTERSLIDKSWVSESRVLTEGEIKATYSVTFRKWLRKQVRKLGVNSIADWI